GAQAKIFLEHRHYFALVARVLTEGHRFDHSFCQAQDNVRRIDDPIAPRANADSLIRNLEIRRVCQRTKPSPLCNACGSEGHHRSVNVRGEKRLKNRWLVADHPHLQLILFGLHTQSVQNNHRLQPESPTDALYPEVLFPQGCERIDLLPHDELPRYLIERRRDAADLRSSGDSAQDRGNGETKDLDISRHHSRYTHIAGA